MYQQRGFGFSFALTPVVKRLLIATVAAFFVMLLVGQEVVFEWFAFRPDRVLTRPWGMVTYMFVHADFMHLFVNMLVLFFFGPPLEARWGSREFTRFYLVAGLGGVALSFVLSPVAVVGASAAIYGVMLAFAMTWPNAPIYVWGIFPVKAKWLVAFFFVLTLFGAFGSSGGPVADFAHLGGLVTGFIYLKADWRAGRALDRIRRAAPGPARKLAIVPGEERESAHRARRESARAEPGEGEERRLLDEVDRVLDKISVGGMASLTDAERELLDEVSRRRRMN